MRGSAQRLNVEARVHKRLGEILVAEGVIDGQQLQEALSSCAASGTRLGEHLVQSARCEEAQIVGALAKQLGIPIADLPPGLEISPKILSYLPPELVRQRQLLPIGFTPDGALELVLADPTDLDLLDEVRFQTGCDLAPRVGPTSALEATIARHYPAPEATPEPPAPAPLSSDPSPDLAARVAALEAQVVALTEALAALQGSTPP